MILTVSLAALLSAGCPAPLGPVADSSKPGAPADDPNVDAVDLVSEVRQVLRANLEGRALATDVHGGWQILHGILAYGKDFEILTPGGTVPAVEYLQAGGVVSGFDPILGDEFVVPGEAAPRRGLRMDLQPSTKIGQGHRDQWLAVIAQAGLTQTDTLQSDDHEFTMGDWIRQVEYDIPRNLETEFSWTLIGLLAYRDTDHRWTARDGNDYNIEGLLGSELDKDLADSTCGGTHRLIGISKALLKRRSENKPIVGVWKRAETVVAESLALAKQNQNPDGSFSVSYHHRSGWTRDLGEALGTTGHVLEFIATAADADMLEEPWVKRSVTRLDEILVQCIEIDLECGALYHGLHGLVEYEKAFP